MSNLCSGTHCAAVLALSRSDGAAEKSSSCRLGQLTGTRPAEMALPAWHMRLWDGFAAAAAVALGKALPAAVSAL